MLAGPWQKTKTETSEPRIQIECVGEPVPLKSDPDIESLLWVRISLEKCSSLEL